MGNCIGVPKLPNNVFKVRNINEEKRLVQKGLMEVTTGDLVYTDGRSLEQWVWPLKYLRKYGCDGEVFTFEAGRKCPGGEGLYAFETRKASQLFDLVARNINTGNLQSPNDVSVSEMPGQDVTSISSLGRTHISNLESFDHSAAATGGGVGGPVPPPLEAGKISVPSSTQTTTSSLRGLLASEVLPPPSPPKTKFEYKEVVFDTKPEDHPLPMAAASNKVSYSQINFEKLNGTLPVQGSSGSSSSSRLVPRPMRTRSSTAPGRGHKGRSVSTSSMTSQGSASASAVAPDGPYPNRVTRAGLSPSAPSGGSIASGNGGGGGAMYQNLSLGPHGQVLMQQPHPLPHPLPQPQPEYQNMTIRGGQRVDSSTPTRPLPLDIPKDLPNYENLRLSSGGSSGDPRTPTDGAVPVSPITTSPLPPIPVPIPHGYVATTVVVGGGANTTSGGGGGGMMGNYADLDLSASGAGRSAGQLSYSELEFSRSQSSSSTVGGGIGTARRATSSSGVGGARSPEPVVLEMSDNPPHHPHPHLPHHRDRHHTISQSSITSPGGGLGSSGGHAQYVVGACTDDKVNYGTLNFKLMEAVSELKVVREQEKQADKLHHQIREVAIGSSSSSKKHK